MKTVHGPAVAPILVIAPLALAQSDDVGNDASHPAALDPDTTRVLLYRSGEDAFPGHVATDRDRQAHRRGLEQLLMRELYADFFVSEELTQRQSDDLVRSLADERTDRRLAATIRAEREAWLGRERFAALVQYEDSLPERMALQKLSTWLRALDYPLTPDQKEALVAIMRSERHRLDPVLLQAPPETVEHASEVIALRDAYDRHVRALFDAILTPDQREIADRQFAERRERRHDALARYTRGRAEGDKQPFTYPAD